MDSKSTRSCRLEVSCQKDALKNFTKLTRKRLCQSLFYNKFVTLSSVTLLKKRLRYRCLPMNFPIFLATSFLERTSLVAASALIHYQWKMCSKVLDFYREEVFHKSLCRQFSGGLEFSSYAIALRNRFTQNDVTLRVTNSKIKLSFFYFRVTNSKLKNKKLTSSY